MKRHATVVLVLLLVVMILTASACLSAVIYVKPDGDDANDGFSWNTAKKTIGAGLNTALSGDEVWVAKGTYVERITLKDGVGLYGGFEGTETSRDQRNWRTNVTIIDGNQAGSVVTSPSGAGQTTTIDGFTIRNGNASYGGGIYCYYNSSPTITNNMITSNTASYGGGIYCTNSSLTITNNTITSNKASPFGGGICCFDSSPTITNNTITSNIASYGGGIYCSNSYPTITNNTITSNKASNGGGIYCSNSYPTITNNTITSNTASSGGGIYCYYNSSPTITNNTINSNNASDGGGIHIYSSSPSISNNIIAFNSSGIRNSGGTPTLRNNCVYGNISYNYSGISAGVGDISSDPKFASLEYGNLHIQPDSPCRDAGWNEAPGLPDKDMDGECRVQGAAVDIGADESDGTEWPAGPRIIVRVSPSGNDANDGSSWALAKKTVQAGIDAAAALGGEVWVAAGTYNERITLRPFVYVYGGFAGTELSKEERDWSRNKSILDGGDGGSVVTCIGIWYALSRLDGFTIRNGNASNGGGIYCYYSSPTITNNTISGNNASPNGGGIYCDNSSPTITNNTITSNTASYGGGIYCTNSSLTITNNTITSNTASLSYGGGIYCTNSSPTITNNTITSNNAFDGGGIYIYYSGSPSISNNIIAFNSSGIRNSGGTPTLRNNCVYGNISYNYSGISAGVGDISSDPKFASLEYGNLHIQPDSPCRDAGWNKAPGLPDKDMDGECRVQGAAVDIGADESDGTEWPVGPRIIVRVSPSGNDANDGSSWALAKKTVQAGIDAAAALGGEVWVAAGTYNERITLRLFVHVYGGFAGTELSKEERDWNRNESILDGGGSDSVVRCIDTWYALSRLDGFTIRNGNASEGGGIYCSYSSPTITNNKIIGNNASYKGGGIYCFYSSPVITNNTITSNNASGGGGICCDYYSSPTITNNTIIGNGGGGIHISSSSSPSISNNIIAFNSSGIRNSGGTPTLRNNCVYGNIWYDYSGISAGEGDISSDPKFVDKQNGNFHIQADSPCRNKGWNEAPGLPDKDMDGEPRIFEGIVDIGADEFYVPSVEPQDIYQAKLQPDNTSVIVSGKTVTAVFGDVFYIESDDRSSGIRVFRPEHGMSVGMKVDVWGVVKTNNSYEKYIEATSAVQTGSGTPLKPISMVIRNVGGGDWHFNPATGAGQRGVFGGFGLNNIGLFIAVTGRVTAVDTDYFYVDDGSLASDNTNNTGIRVEAMGLSVPAVGDTVYVKGISSCFVSSGVTYRRILAVGITNVD